VSEESIESIESGRGEKFVAFTRTIERLRQPDGCPWDREQTHASIARNMIEEAHEAVDAIERDDMLDLREELGDVLLQVVLQSQIAAEEGAFTIDDVIAGVNDKMIRRHPHVFGDEEAFAAAHLTAEQIEQIRAAQTPGKVLDLWDQIKLIEKQRKAERKAQLKDARVEGLLDGVPPSLPALMQAQDISRKAVSAGFEWETVEDVWHQVALELEEFKQEPQGSVAASEEFGDVLFSLVNVARKEGIDAESALRQACHKFRRRWAIMEQYANEQGKRIEEFDIEGLETLWQTAKVDLSPQASSEASSEVSSEGEEVT
jgi:tetrapyrrole methylase family protein/MazG family protein